MNDTSKSFITADTWNWQNSSLGTFLEINAPIKTMDPKSGIRVISNDGKHAKTRFQYLYYDQNSHTTLIACYPITGRSHQIRVHLQWIGFPILDDVQYGGGHVNDTNEEWNQIVKQSMISSKNVNDAKDVKDIKDSIKEKNYLEDEYIEKAHQICPICKYGEKGIESSFTSAQLLQQGHSIHLHAFQYILFFYSKKRKLVEDEKQIISKLEFMTHLPLWAEQIHSNHLMNVAKSLFV